MVVIFVSYMRTYSRHPGSNQSSNIKCRALRKKRIASQAYNTSTTSLQLFVTQGILETKTTSLYLSAINAFLIHQLFQLPTWMFGIQSPLWPGAPQPSSSLFAWPLSDFIWCSQLFYWKESSHSIPAHPLHLSQGFIFDPVHGWSALTCLFFTKKLFYTFDHHHCFLWTFIQLYFFWQEGKELHSLKEVVYNSMCSKDILYLLTLEILIAFLTSSEYCRSWN